MSPRRAPGRSRNGLFVWTPTGDVQPDEITDNPLTRPCTWCHAAPRQRCRRPSRGGWTETSTFHDARKSPAQPSSSPTQPRTGPQ